MPSVDTFGHKVVTFEEVYLNIQKRMHEAIMDIQYLLEGACCNNCQECEFQYMCIRDEDVISN